MAKTPTHALVVSDMPASTDFAAAVACETRTVVTLYHDHAFPADSDTLRFRPPGVFAWHEQDGRNVHRDLERLAWAFADRIEANGHSAGLSGAPTALKFLLVDALLWPYYLLRRFQALLDISDDDSQIVLYFRDPVLEGAARTMLAIKTAGQREPVSPDVVSDPCADRTVRPLVLKPAIKDRIRWYLIRMEKRMWRQYRDLQRAGYLPRTAGMPQAAKGSNGCLEPNLAAKLDAFAAKLLARETSGKPMAVLCWNCRDGNYANALLRTLREILSTRPALLLLEGKAQLVRGEIEKLEKVSGRPVLVVSIDELTGLVRGHGEVSGGAATEALNSMILDPELGPSDIAVLRHVAIEFARNSASVRVFQALLELFRRVPRARIAYSLFASARAAYYAAVAEHLARLGVVTIDVHVYLVGNHARQMPPPTHYAAVIDDQQEALLSSFWRWTSDRCVRVGYLWREPTAPTDAGSSAGNDRPVVVICTQPGESSMVKGFFSDVLAGLRGLDPANVLVKPHPAETEATLLFYAEAIQGHPLGRRISVLNGKDQLTDILKGADLVLTRTSNAGIEAALMGKPTVRYLAYDLYDRSVEHEVAYARTISSPEDLIASLQELVGSLDARRAQVKAQEPYLKENPAQAAADGPRRLVEFMEGKVHGIDGRPGQGTILHG